MRPDSEGATEHHQEYLSEEQRSQAGCSAGRMQSDFHHGLLGSAGEFTGTLSHAIGDILVLDHGRNGCDVSAAVGAFMMLHVQTKCEG